MTAAEEFLMEARTAFRLASDSALPKAIECYAMLGMKALQLAQAAAKPLVMPIAASPRWGALPLAPVRIKLRGLISRG